MFAEFAVSKDQPPIVPIVPKAQEPKSSNAGCYIALATIGSVGLMIAGVGVLGFFTAGADLRTYSIILMGTGGALAVGSYGSAAVVAIVKACTQRRQEKKSREEQLLAQEIARNEALKPSDWWKVGDSHAKIQKLQENERQIRQERESGYKSVWFGDNSKVTVTMLSKETFETEKENLARCNLLKIRFTNSEPTDNIYALEKDIPDEILSYIISGSEDYKNAPLERLPLLLPVAEYLDIPEMLNHFKLEICKSLIAAKANDQESEFIHICEYVGTYIEKWANLAETGS